MKLKFKMLLSRLPVYSRRLCCSAERRENLLMKVSSDGTFICYFITLVEGK